MKDGSSKKTGLFLIAFAIVMLIMLAAEIIIDRTAHASGCPSYFNSNQEEISCNTDTLENLKEDTWHDLNNKEKLEVLDKVAAIELNYLGFPDEYFVTVTSSDLGKDNPDMLACWRRIRHQIVIDEDHLQNDSSEEVLESVLHETYHAYETYLVSYYKSMDKDMKNMPYFRRLKQYAEELKNYVPGEEEQDKYYRQVTEKDACDYARSRIRDYFDVAGDTDITASIKESWKDTEQGGYLWREQ